MKKNVMMRAASFLLVAVLLTTSVISGTFAKYVTSTSGNDSARVAYWGFNSTTLDLGNLFSPQYVDTKVDTNGAVKSEDGDDVIAPGTSGSVTFGFGYEEIAGAATRDTVAQGINAPEVKYEFKVDVTADCAQDIKTNPNITWTLDGVACTGFDNLVDKIKALSGNENGTATYMPGNLPAAFAKTDTQHTIGWAWAYDTADDTGTTDVNEMANQDTTDTTMGNKTSLDTCSIAITITAKQLNN